MKIYHPIGNLKISIIKNCAKFLNFLIFSILSLFLKLNTKKNEIIISTALSAPWKEDETFSSFYEKIKELTLLDTKRLYTLWYLSKDLKNINANIIDIGCMQGGAGLAMSKINNKGQLLTKTKIRTKKRNKNVLVLSRSHISDKKKLSEMKDFMFKKFKANKIIQSGSSIKLCYIAHGKANIYPRIGTTMEWDIAAGDAILRNAGGTIKTLDGKIMKYGKRNYKNKSFIARN